MLRLLLLCALLSSPMSAMAETWHNHNVDRPETLGEILTVEFTITADHSGGSVNFPRQSTQKDTTNTTPWVTGKDSSGPCSGRR